MRIVIDALNIRAGGGLTHLREFISAIPSTGRNLQVIVLATVKSSEKLPVYPWLTVINPPTWARGLLGFYVWRPFGLDRLITRMKPDVLFVPGGLYEGSFRPFVTMAQNLLPFEPVERAREGRGLKRVRLHLLEWLQLRTFRRAKKVIYVSRFSKDVIEPRIGNVTDSSVVVYHGLNERFKRQNLPLASQGKRAAGPFRWLYVSNIDAYKNQTSVVEAARMLFAEGRDFTLDFVGPGPAVAVARLRQVISVADTSGQRLRYLGRLDYESIEKAYGAADGFIYASSCETFGMIVLEAMAAGLPIASSKCSAIPEIVGDAGVFFDPTSPSSIAEAMGRIMSDEGLRTKLAERALQRANEFSWGKCARETLAVFDAALKQSPEKTSSAVISNSTSTTQPGELSGVPARELFDSIATKWEDKYEDDGSMTHRRKRFCDLLNTHVPQKGRLLDFGCASGDLSATFNKAGYHVSGVDQAPAMIERAATRFGTAGIEFKLLRPEQVVVLPFGEEYFSAIVASSVAEYLVPLSAYLKEWNRVAAPGAVLLVTVPNPLNPIRWLESTEILISRFAKTAPEKMSNRARYLRTSVNRFDSGQWRRLLADCGWTLIGTEGRFRPLLMIVARKYSDTTRS